MNIHKLNLNLLIALDALLTERNITRAGNKLFITQPAMSNALRQLREIFQDALLARKGNDLVLTPKAQELLPQVKNLLELATKIFTNQQFEPSTSNRIFKIGMTEYADLILMPSLYKCLAESAPHARLEIKHLNLFQEEKMIESQEIELGLGLFCEQPKLFSFPHDILFKDRFVCVATAKHPLFQKELTLENYLQASHVCFAVYDKTASFVTDSVFKNSGHVRNVTLRVPLLWSALQTIEQSQLIATIPERIAYEATRTLKLTMKTPPLEFPEPIFTQLWHPKYENDAGHRWLRSLIKKIVCNCLDIKQKVA